MNLLYNLYIMQLTAQTTGDVHYFASSLIKQTTVPKLTHRVYEFSLSVKSGEKTMKMLSHSVLLGAVLGGIVEMDRPHGCMKGTVLLF